MFAFDMFAYYILCLCYDIVLVGHFSGHWPTVLGPHSISWAYGSNLSNSPHILWDWRLWCEILVFTKSDPKRMAMATRQTEGLWTHEVGRPPQWVWVSENLPAWIWVQQDNLPWPCKRLWVTVKIAYAISYAILYVLSYEISYTISYTIFHTISELGGPKFRWIGGS